MITLKRTEFQQGSNLQTETGCTVVTLEILLTKSCKIYAILQTLKYIKESNENKFII